MNTLIFSGRVTFNPEMISISEKNVCNFRIAAKKKFKEETQFLLCVAFGNVATLIHKYVKKGAKIIVNGYLELQEYEDENGKRIIPKCIVKEFKLMDFVEEEYEYF